MSMLQVNQLWNKLRSAKEALQNASVIIQLKSFKVFLFDNVFTVKFIILPSLIPNYMIQIVVSTVIYNITHFR